MVFLSKLPGIARPRQDVFSYILEKRRPYSEDRIMYHDVQTNEVLTFGDLVRRSRQLAGVLTDRFGLEPMDVVAILAADSVMYPIIYLSILAAGGTVELIPVQRELTVKDVTARMEQAGAKLIVTDSKLRAMAILAAEQLGQISVLIPDEEPHLLAQDVPEFRGFHIESNAAAEASAAFLNRTSGSTGGKMKTVVTSHAHFIATLKGTLDTIPENTDPDHDVWLSTLSFGFFINAKLNIGLNLLLGVPVIIPGHPFGPEHFNLIEQHRITFLFIPPPVAAAIAGSDLRASADVSSIKWLLSAGASMHEGLQQSVSQKLNNVHLDLEWGTTETLLIAMQTKGRSSPLGSSGVLVNGMEAKVIDIETGEDLDVDEPGEILVRNMACRFTGYKDNEAANAAAFDSEGWFHSGDFGYIDNRSNVFIKDRLKELIRVGDGYGVHISAVEIEALIFEHPAVAQVIVTGVPDASTGSERPTAFVVLSPEWQLRRESAQQSLEEWARAHLTGLQTLQGGFIFLDRFPLLSFKIDRRALKALAIDRARILSPPLAPAADVMNNLEKPSLVNEMQA